MWLIPRKEKKEIPTVSKRTGDETPTKTHEVVLAPFATVPRFRLPPSRSGRADVRQPCALGAPLLDSYLCSRPPDRF